jgi:asparagine synthetase B (glutamine-hydrolysing)
MCGILCRIGTVPIQHDLVVELVPDGEFLRWENQNPSVIKELIAQDIRQYELSQSDINKLNNLDALRLLNDKIVKLRNNVKLLPEDKEQQVLEIQAKIDDIIQEQGSEDAAPDVSPNEMFRRLMYKIAARGPDYVSITQVACSGVHFDLFSSVLSLRQPFTKQPINNNELLLQFNGELYNSETLDSNDTSYIFGLLQNNLMSYDRNLAIFRTINELRGEFSFALHDLREGKVYFGRDAIGKRSLVYKKDDETVLISSVPLGTSFVECTNEIITYDLKTKEFVHTPYSTNYTPMANNLDIDISKTTNGLMLQLTNAVKIRQEAIHPLHPHKASLGVLFSGGLDCTVIASLICENFKTSPPSTNIYNIDLLTVGFDNPRTNQGADSSPDRKLAKKSWFHLAQKYNSRSINIRLVEINVDYKLWLLHQKRVKDLMYPVNTEMDLSIAIAFYFASSNSTSEARTTMTSLSSIPAHFEAFLQNELSYCTIQTNYNSEAAVLFSGLGADELFAGYSRHEAIFQCLSSVSTDEEIKKCYNKLSSELVYDINIIHSRNLGRDDRVIGCWGKELRYPYLDEELIAYVINRIEPNLKFSYSFEKRDTKKRGEIEVMVPIRKFILRECAKALGLNWVKHEIKRAIQFGAKSAKLEIGQSKVKGTDSL